MSMQLRKAGIVVATAGALAAGGYAAAGIATAAAASTSHTLRFVTHPVKDTQIGKSDVEASKDTSNGKTLGYDVTDCIFNLSTGNATCHAAVARAQGLIYATFKVHNPQGGPSGPITGKVTGGTNAYKGARGTLTATPNANGTTTVVLRFTT